MSEEQKELISISLKTHGGDMVSIQFVNLDNLYFIEDIYSLGITGKLSFYDRNGIIEKYSISGGESIYITYGSVGDVQDTTGKTKTIMLNVYKIESIRSAKQSTITDDLKITMLLVDEDYNDWHNNIWYKGWSDDNNVLGVQVKTIVYDIMKYVTNPSETLNILEDIKTFIPQFDMHSKTPAECVKWLLDRSVSIYDTYGYLLYRSSQPDKTFFDYTLTTLDGLLSSTNPYMKPYDDTNLCNYMFNPSNINYINKIKYINIMKPDYNSLKSIMGGSVLGFDSKTKSFINNKYTFEQSLLKCTILGKYTLFPTNLKDTYVGTRIELDGTSSSIIADNIWYGNWIKEYCLQHLVEIVVGGHEGRYAGGKIKITWPSSIGVDANSTNRTEINNKQYTGDYLVKSITNYFSPSVEKGWIQKMVLIKNGYDDTPTGSSFIEALKTVGG